MHEWKSLTDINLPITVICQAKTPILDLSIQAFRASLIELTMKLLRQDSSRINLIRCLKKDHISYLFEYYVLQTYIDKRRDWRLTLIN